MAIGAAFGVERIKVDDFLSQLFRSDTPQFKQYEEVTRRFPSSEYDVLVVVEGKQLLSRNSLDHLRDLVTDLQLVDGARGIISLFSARQPSPDGGLPAPLFPEELPQGSGYDKLIERVKANEIIRGKLLSEDGSLALIVLALDPDVVGDGKLNQVVADIRKTMAEDLAGANVTAELSGVPVLQLEIRNALERDRVVYNMIGFAAGCAIAIFFFRRVSFMIVAAAPPLLAILLSLGALGWLDFRLNMFLNVMTPLIMVISFSDSMQITFAARDRLIAGEDRYAAFRNAVWIVGPACVLTHATAGLSFLALQFSDLDLIRAFGEAGLIATVIALIAVLTLTPAFGVLLVRRESALATNSRFPSKSSTLIQSLLLSMIFRSSSSLARSSASACFCSVKSSTKATCSCSFPSMLAAPTRTGTRPPSLRKYSFSSGWTEPVHHNLGEGLFGAIPPFRRRQLHPVDTAGQEICAIIPDDAKVGVVGLDYPSVALHDADPDNVCVNQPADLGFASFKIAVQTRIL